MAKPSASSSDEQPPLRPFQPGYSINSLTNSAQEADVGEIGQVAAEMSTGNDGPKEKDSNVMKERFPLKYISKFALSAG